MEDIEKLADVFWDEVIELWDKAIIDYFDDKEDYLETFKLMCKKRFIIKSRHEPASVKAETEDAVIEEVKDYMDDLDKHFAKEVIPKKEVADLLHTILANQKNGTVTVGNIKAGFQDFFNISELR